MRKQLLGMTMNGTLYYRRKKINRQKQIVLQSK